MIGPPVDISGRGPTTGRLAWWGVAMIALVVAVATPVVLYGQRTFESRVELTVVSPRVADSLTAGADVKYRGLLVGRVESVEVTADGRQRMRVAVDAEQARNIDGALTAKFVPSNIFGVVGIELDRTGAGPTLSDGANVEMTGESADVSAIAVLRDIGSITSTLTGDDVTAMINRLDRVVSGVSPLISAGFELFDLAHRHQQMPFAQVLRISTDLVDAGNRMTEPFVTLFTTLVEKTEMYADPVQEKKVTGALTGLVQTFITLGQVVGASPVELATVLDASLTLGAPMGYTLATVPAAAGDTLELLRRLDKTFVRRDDGVRLRLGAALTSMPQITSALAGMDAGRRSRQGGR
ncbi:MlaD family protein [Gordonia sp. ABSL1-1]|uniref:MlaD family protein n=1 Tax=Gordonia sp. ABSL1-1 TaxID=3053923 RepID=UPI0025730BBC|nr:MlaD family protein [Gordonia sp. ABSL1-1]MDL9938889.1 MlaD family protein [Gordonia sp. ABSL1-1]